MMTQSDYFNTQNFAPESWLAFNFMLANLGNLNNMHISHNQYKDKSCYQESNYDDDDKDKIPEKQKG